jgi:hypothetical protein
MMVKYGLNGDMEKKLLRKLEVNSCQPVIPLVYCEYA